MPYTTVPLERPSNLDCRVLTTWIDTITSSNSSLSEILALESLVCSFDLPMTPTQKATSLLLAWISYVSRLTVLFFFGGGTLQVVLKHSFQKANISILTAPL